VSVLRGIFGRYVTVSLSRPQCHRPGSGGRPA